MNTGYGWEGIRQVCATLLGARHVPERLVDGWQFISTFDAKLANHSGGRSLADGIVTRDGVYEWTFVCTVQSIVQQLFHSLSDS